MVKWRWQLERCAAFDIAASNLDRAMAAKLNVQPMPHFGDDQVGARLAAFAPFVPQRLKSDVYLRALLRSTTAWLPIQIAIRAKG